jgi:hypothetical protein
MGTVSAHAAMNVAITAGRKVRIFKIPSICRIGAKVKGKYIKCLAAFARRELIWISLRRYEKL